MTDILIFPSEKPATSSLLLGGNILVLMGEMTKLLFDKGRKMPT
jgi:hypothetical protein